MDERNYRIDPKTNCWNWTRNIGKNGYGRLMINYVSIYAHRYSYQLHKGDIPKGLFVCHSCDNRRCVNPNHLWIGTHTDNVRDMFSKGRNPRQTKIRIDINQLVSLNRCGLSQRKIAKRMGISKGTVQYHIERLRND